MLSSVRFEALTGYNTSMLASLLLGLSLAMDCLAIALSQGLRSGVRHRHLIRLALLFGLFQGGMLLAGWAGAFLLLSRLGAIMDWIAALLLAGIGLKMLREAFAAEDEDESPELNRWRDYLVLSLATSIDALAAGLTLPALQLSVPLATLMTGLTSLGMALLGGYAGRLLGSHFGQRAEILGGLVLIGLGVKVLLF